MAHFEHSTPTKPVNEAEVARHSRIGLILFAVYSLLYGTFMLLNAFAPQAMDTVVFAEINLALAYGLGLIAAAFILALVYAWLCRSPRASEAGE